MRPLIQFLRALLDLIEVLFNCYEQIKEEDKKAIRERVYKEFEDNPKLYEMSKREIKIFRKVFKKFERVLKDLKYVPVDYSVEEKELFKNACKKLRISENDYEKRFRLSLKYHHGNWIDEIN
jgi:pyruvate/2-oxoacid:ferredoxin oxidoreductase beta subunit